MTLSINESNFENETMKNDIIHFGPKVIIEDNIDGVENKNTFICFNCKKKVRFYISSLSVSKATPELQMSICLWSMGKTTNFMSLSIIEFIDHWPSSLSTIESINHWAYWPWSLSTMEPINHRVYQSLSLSTIKPIDHWVYRPWSLSTMEPISHQAYQPL